MQVTQDPVTGGIWQLHAQGPKPHWQQHMQEVASSHLGQHVESIVEENVHPDSAEAQQDRSPATAS